VITSFAYENIALILAVLYKQGTINQTSLSEMVKELLESWQIFSKVFPIGRIPMLLYTAKLERLTNKAKALCNVRAALKLIEEQKIDCPYYKASLLDELAAHQSCDPAVAAASKQMFQQLGIPKREVALAM